MPPPETVTPTRHLRGGGNLYSRYKLAVIPGDGIGPEIVNQGLKVLDRVGQIYGHKFEYSTLLAGGCAIDVTGEPLPNETIEVCKKSDAVILGAVGGHKWDTLPGHLRPEKALLGLRGQLGLFANLRPAVIYKELIDACPLKPEIIGDSIDIMVVRELTGGIYFGERGRRMGKMGQEAFDTETYSVGEVERIARIAFEIANKRKKKVTSIDKANILESSRLWREVVTDVSKDYPAISLDHLYVDNAAMQLIRDPRQFDVIVTSNMFGDILSDEASMITGSIGMLPSASLGEDNFGLYEPIHGSAPDIAGQDKANPIATVLSIAMLLRYTLHLENEANAVENAVNKVLEEGYRTGDIMSPGKTLVGTTKMGELIVEKLSKI
ncbi:MAG: 3-isopropylmalate dehydrogenase [Clostridiaceae bacterium]|nr:3-isopropylmalate dehydrogenase [Clostridiaceae bacterium]